MRGLVLCALVALFNLSNYMRIGDSRDEKSYHKYPLDGHAPHQESGPEELCLAGDGLLILHVGPIKTGTSSIQCTLQRSPFLQNSSYTYIGRYENERRICSPGKYPLQDPTLGNERFFPQNIVFQGGSRYQLKAAWKIKHRLLELKGEYDKNSTTSGNVSIPLPPHPPRNAIFSAEEFEGMVSQDENTWDVLKDALSPYEGRTRVIVTHRNLFEVILSSFYEEFVKRDTPNKWDDPGIISFPTFWSSEDRKDLFNPTSKVVDAYKDHSFNVSIFDFHGRGDGKEQGDDLVTRFLCNLPCAEAACNAHKNDIATSGKDATSRPSLKARHQYDTIAKEAYDRGLLGKYDLSRRGTDRKAAVRAIEDYVVNKLGIKFNELPFICPSREELDKILKLSIEDGKKVLEHNFDEEKHVKMFKTFMDKKYMCAVDVDALIKDNDWAQFLQNDLFPSKH